MAETAPQPWTVDAFFAWQERQADRYELVGGFPLKVTATAPNLHDDIVVNLVALVGGQLRGTPRRLFTGRGSVETSKGQIRRPDLGVDCGRRDPNGFKAAEPRLVLEVLSPGTRDFDTFEKLGEYKAVEALDHLVFVEPDMPLLVHWSRDAGRGWVRRDVEGLDAAVELADLGVTLSLAEVYDGVAFPPRLRAV